MSQFSNPSTNAAGAAASYTRALLDVLGDRDPLEVMRETPRHLPSILGGLSEERLRQPEREGKWSIAQVLRHIADTEIVYANRFRFPVGQDSPTIVGFDQEQWVARLYRPDEPIERIVAQFEVVRDINLRFLSALTEEEWERTGMHAERGAESVRHMVKLGAAHDLVHRRQMERIREAVGESSR
jgi:uncharacterized damage-inducible protein DinB